MVCFCLGPRASNCIKISLCGDGLRERGLVLLLRDADIRTPLHDWLWQAHLPCDDTVIIHELSIPRPSARVDIAVVNGQICGFEIKSDVDGLSRLPRQVKSFNAIFDSVSVVTTRRHIESAKKIVPNWWGILAPLANGEFEYVRQSLGNPMRDAVAVLHMLTRYELCDVLAAHKLLRGFKSKTRPILIRAISDFLTVDEQLFAARYALKQRSRGQSPSPSSP